MARTAHVAVSHRLLDFTAHQDVQLTAGLDFDWPRPPRTALGGISSKLKAVRAASAPH
jgi:hypothetical protein